MVRGYFNNKICLVRLLVYKLFYELFHEEGHCLLHMIRHMSRMRVGVSLALKNILLSQVTMAV